MCLSMVTGPLAIEMEVFATLLHREPVAPRAFLPFARLWILETGLSCRIIGLRQVCACVVRCGWKCPPPPHDAADAGDAAAGFDFGDDARMAAEFTPILGGAAHSCIYSLMISSFSGPPSCSGLFA